MAQSVKFVMLGQLFLSEVPPYLMDKLIIYTILNVQLYMVIIHTINSISYYFCMPSLLGVIPKVF